MAESLDDLLAAALSTPSDHVVVGRFLTEARIVIFCYLRKRIPSSALDDVTQDALVALYSKLGDYDAGKGSARSWVLGFGHTQLLKFPNARVPRGDHIPLPDSVFAPSSSPGPRTSLELEQQRGFLEQWREQLRGTLRRALIQWANGLSTAEAAELEGVTPRTIRAWRARLAKRAAARLRRWAGEPPPRS